MESDRICPNCQNPLPPEAPLGLCPECLIKAGFPGGTEASVGTGRGFAPPPVEEIGKLFPQLEILGFIGKGGMGAVYKARQPALGRLVALKVLPAAARGDPGFGERFNREARTLARLNHPNIVAVHDFGKRGEMAYLLMEFVEGTNLREIEQAGRLSSAQALAIVPQICDALQFAHSEGIVHRDIKPENLLLDKKGRLKITDFGIAKMLGAPAGNVSLTGAQDLVGTPHYMAPEQIENPQAVDQRADIYSLGVVIYEMLTGELPLGKFGLPSERAQVDARLDEVVLHALEKQPERRYQQASQLKADVERIATTTPPEVIPATRPKTNNEAFDISRSTIIAPAVGLLIAGILKLFSLLKILLFFAWPGSEFLNTTLSSLGIAFPFHWNAVFGMSAVVFGLIPALVIILGTVEMIRLRSYGCAIAAAVMAIVSCSLVGFPVGVWALVVLTRSGTREAFANPAARWGVAKCLWILTAAVAASCLLTLAVSIFK